MLEIAPVLDRRLAVATLLTFPQCRDISMFLNLDLNVGNNVDESIVVKKAHEPECCWLVEERDEDCQVGK